MHDLNYEAEVETFDLAPISLWLEDFSEVRQLFDTWRQSGVTDIKAYLSENENRIKQCSSLIRVIKVNKRTLSLFEADDFEHLTQNLGSIFHDDMLQSHIQELAALWNGDTEFSSDTVNYTLSGRRLDIQLRGAILPGYENS